MGRRSTADPRRVAARDRHRAGAALTACLRGDSTAALAGLGTAPGVDGAFVTAAVRHGVPGYAWCVGGHGLAAPHREGLQAACHRSIARHLRTLAELPTAGRVLSQAGVDWLVCKGPVLAEVVHGQAGLRDYHDLDVLVRPSHLPAALAALEASGARTVDVNWALLARELRGEIHLVLPHGTAVDLHWHVVNSPGVRSAFDVDIEGLLDRRVLVDVNGESVPTLDPVDTVLHLALHTMISGGDRLVWFKDLERAVAVLPVDWAELARRAQAARLELVVATAMAMTRTVLRVDLPGAPSLRTPGQAAWFGLVRGVLGLAPPPRTRHRGSPTRIVCRATRDDVPASLAEAGRRAARSVTRWRSRHPAGYIAPTSPGSMHYAAGGPAARAAFLDAVARWPAGDRGSRRPDAAGGSRRPHDAGGARGAVAASPDAI